jgi:2'-5' RNA ligase
MNLRCFIAVGIPDAVKEGISGLIDVLKKHEGDVKWIKPENLHLTLKFLGSTPEDLIPGIGEALFEVASSSEPFYIRIYSTGVFPNKKYPRVIWVGMEDSQVLGRLRDNIEEDMSRLGFKKEGKEFKPHLTIGRVRSPKGMINIITELENFKDKDFGTVTVDAVKLMKSELKPKGAEYTCLRALPFGGKL